MKAHEQPMGGESWTKVGAGPPAPLSYPPTLRPKQTTLKEEGIHLYALGQRLFRENRWWLILGWSICSDPPTTTVTVRDVTAEELLREDAGLKSPDTMSERTTP